MEALFPYRACLARRGRPMIPHPAIGSRKAAAPGTWGPGGLKCLAIGGPEVEETTDAAFSLDRITSELAALVYELEQERLAWREAIAEQAAEIQRLTDRQDKTEENQLVIGAETLQLSQELRDELAEVKAELTHVSRSLERIGEEQARRDERMERLRDEVAGLSSTLDEVFDDLAGRLTEHQAELSRLEDARHDQEDRLRSELEATREELAEGLLGAVEAANRHSEAIAELNERVGGAIAQFDQQRLEVADQLARATEGVEERLSASEAAGRERESALRAQVDSQLATAAQQMESQGTAMRVQLEAQAGALRAQVEALNALQGTVQTQHEAANRELSALKEAMPALAENAQQLAIALDAVQAGAIKAEEQTMSWARGQFEQAHGMTGAVHRQLEETARAVNQALEQLQRQIKELEAKAVKALGAQHQEVQEQEKRATQLREDHAQLANRVGTIVQLLMKASRPGAGGTAPFTTGGD